MVVKRRHCGSVAKREALGWVFKFAWTLGKWPHPAEPWERSFEALYHGGAGRTAEAQAWHSAQHIAGPP